MRRTLAILPLLLLLSTGGQAAEPLMNLLAPGGWQLLVPHPADASLETAAGNDAPDHGEVLRLNVKVPCDPLWLIQIIRGIPANVPAGELMRLHFWARSATRNPLRVTVEQSQSPYNAVGESALVLTPEWQEFTVEGTTPGYGANGLSAHFQAGKQVGLIEIVGVSVVDAGVDPAIAAMQDTLRPEQIQARIEKYRKGLLTITVEDAAGRPVPGATVKVTQTRHAFLFGANIFNLHPADDSTEQRAYQEEFTALFNYATLPFYWGAFESRQGQPDNARLQAMADWCIAHGLTPKGHPLIWHEVWPTWGPADADAAVALLHARVSDLIPRYRDTIHYWDVLNEANGASTFHPANGETAWIKRDGAAAVVGTALDWARTARRAAGDPPTTFLYNDYETGPSNVALLGRLQSEGKLPDAIGIQSHMHTAEWPLSKVWQVCETFGRFDRPIHFTETTVLSGPRRALDYHGPDATDWNTTPEGEARQAEYVVQFYTLFVQPSSPARHHVVGLQ